MSSLSVALAGNPNCGKTTLLNALTGANLRVGNWPGVTVERKQARLRFEGCEIVLNDLPGIYSMRAYAVEERVSRDFLLQGAYDITLCVLDAAALSRSLYLALEIKRLGRPVVAAINQADELKRRGGHVDPAALSRALDMPVVLISARTGEGLNALLRLLAACAGRPRAPITRAETPGDYAAFTRAVCQSYAFIDRALESGRYRAAREAWAQPRADRVLLGRLSAYPAFFAILGAMFYLTFGPPGSALSAWCDRAVGCFARLAAHALSALNTPWQMRSLVLDGAIAGVGGVIGFLPQILILFALMALLEESGYMARAAFLADRALRALGISGRAFIPLVMGLGCTTTAVVCARGVDDERDRRMTILLLPNMSCGAKLPVYALFAGAFWPANGGWVIALIYLSGVCALALAGRLLGGTLLKGGQTPFLMELPPYRMPQLRALGRRVAARARDFLLRAGTLIFLMSVAVWFLQSFTPALTWARYGGESIFARLGAWITPVMAPAGLDGWEKCAALISGLVAKEAVVSTLQVLCRAGSPDALPTALGQYFTPASAAAFLAFTLLYTPCIAALSAMRRELGSLKLTLFAAAWQLAGAYGAAVVVYHACALFG